MSPPGGFPPYRGWPISRKSRTSWTMPFAIFNRQPRRIVPMQSTTTRLLTQNQLAALLPLDEKPYVELGHLYEREGKVEQAVDALIKASQRAKDPLPDSLEAADVYRSHKMYDKAVALYRSLQKRFPNSVELLSNLAQTLEQSGQDEQALAVYQQLYKANPTLVWVLDKEATVLTRLKRYPEAVALREQQIAAAPNNPQAYADLIHLYALEGKPEACLAWLQTKAQQQPNK